MRALIVAAGAVPSRAELDAAWPGWSDGLQLVIAADGGALQADALGVQPDLVVGDADSLDADQLDADQLARLRDRGVPFELSPVSKDATDAQLAVEAAVARGATDLLILGAFGGSRLDHAFGNLALLALPALCDRDVALLDATTRVRFVRAEPGGSPTELPLPGAVDRIVSLLPLGGTAEGVTTSGLRYPLRDEPLTLGSTRGVSNIRARPDAAVSLRQGHLYVIETGGEAAAPVAPGPASPHRKGASS